MKIDDKITKKASEMKSKEELFSFIKEQGINIQENDIDAIWNRLHPVEKELSEDELDVISGGGCGNSLDSSNPKCPSCHGELRCYTSNQIAGYDMYECVKCGKELKHIWEGDIWVYA